MYIKKCFGKFIGGVHKCESIVRKVLSIGVSFSLAAVMVPSSVVSAAEPTSFVTGARGNHWGRSNLRAYLNNGTKNDLDMSGSSNSANYPNYFSDEEYNLVEPHTYSTNEFANLDRTVTCVHETKDKFWLPSGNIDSGLILSWGSEDISGNSQYTASTQNDKERLIPRSYWCQGNGGVTWARSPYYNYARIYYGYYYYALVATRGEGVYFDFPNDSNAVAAAFKIPMSSVIFASAASAASHADVAGGSEITITGSANFGKVVSGDLPSYGMYLKKASTHTFTPSALSFSDNTLTVNYSGGVAGQCIMVQAFKSDDLANDTKSYVVGKQLVSESDTLNIDVSNWNLDSLDDYTIKVWMEDKSSASLASATAPVTFVGKNDGGVSSIVKTTDGATEHLRVFAMKEDLKCSWGTLADADSWAGDDATNQKIYFGSDDNDAPLEFWIAGREDSTNNYQIASDGDVMTLYQAVSVGEAQIFNTASNYYYGNHRVTLQLEDGKGFEYTDGKTTVEYPTDSITAKVVSSESGEEKDITTSSLKWQYRTRGSGTWTEGMPTANGEYELRCYAPGVEDSYERTYSAVCAFTVSGVPASGSAADGELTYSGSSLSSSNHDALFLVLTISILVVVVAVAAYLTFLRKRHKNNV